MEPVNGRHGQRSRSMGPVNGAGHASWRGCARRRRAARPRRQRRSWTGPCSSPRLSFRSAVAVSGQPFRSAVAADRVDIILEAPPGFGCQPASRRTPRSRLTPPRRRRALSRRCEVSHVRFRARGGAATRATRVSRAVAAAHRPRQIIIFVCRAEVASAAAYHCSDSSRDRLVDRHTPHRSRAPPQRRCVHLMRGRSCLCAPAETAFACVTCTMRAPSSALPRRAEGAARVLEAKTATRVIAPFIVRIRRRSPPSTPRGRPRRQPRSRRRRPHRAATPSPLVG